MQAKYRHDGKSIDYTPSTAVSAGDVIVIGTVPHVAMLDIEADQLGALAVEGVFDVVKSDDAFTAGDAVYWDPDGNPVGGTAGTGAADTSATGAYLMGYAVEDAGSDDETVRVKLTSAKRTATIAGSITVDDITAGDSTLTISALAGSGGSAGGSAAIAGGAGDTNGAGGAVSLTGGASAGNGTGGAASVVGGAGGATGAGGAANLTGGAGGATSGTGGAVVIAGGAGSAGNANGGSVTIRGGAKNGAGTDGAIVVGDQNTSSITFGKMPRIPVTSVQAAGSEQADAAALIEGFNLVTDANDTKGVKLPSAVAGMQVIVKNNSSDDLLLYPNTSDAIDGETANAAITLSGGACVMVIAADATDWYTLPLVTA